MTDFYLIWSHEHSAWWGPDKSGYVHRFSRAGRYTHAEALKICTEAILGTSTDLGALPELPVRLEDVTQMAEHYFSTFGDRIEPWR